MTDISDKMIQAAQIIDKAKKYKPKKGNQRRRKQV